jgi:hypothetical protein
VWLWNVWWLCSDKLHLQFQKTNSRHCKVSESNWNYWQAQMVYLKANLWNQKRYTATVFGKEQDNPRLKNISRKVKIWNEMWTCEWKVWKYRKRCKYNCEWKVTNKMLKWSHTSENVLRQLQIVQIQHIYVISSQKNKKKQNFSVLPF